MVVAFEGWTDAGDAASSSVRRLVEACGLEAFDEIEPDEYVDFALHRPVIRTLDDGTRALQWPATIASSSMGTPRAMKLRAPSQRSTPTSASASAAPQGMPCSAARRASAAIHCGSVSMRVPSMSNSTASRAGEVTAQA